MFSLWKSIRLHPENENLSFDECQKLSSDTTTRIKNNHSLLSEIYKYVNAMLLPNAKLFVPLEITCKNTSLYRTEKVGYRSLLICILSLSE